MAQGDFKHISVTAADEDDVVINAGIAKPPAGASGETAVAAEVPEATGVRDARLSEGPGGAGREEAEVEAEADEAAPAPARRAGRSQAPKDDGYREATLEDLQGEPMSLTQRVVIIAAVVCIIGALAYYFLFLR